MADWCAYVRERLGSLRCAQAEKEEIAAELAGHLEERYAVLRTEGMSEEEAFARTCALAGNWEELRQGIVLARQEGNMHRRVRQIWVPSLVTLVSSWGVLALLIWATVITNRDEPRGVILYVPWLLLLPVIGAAGAHLSRRAGGAGWRVYLAGIFPALAAAIVFMVVLPFAFASGIDPKAVPGFTLAALAPAVGVSVILPGILLCTGVALQSLRKMRG
jgi:cytochrome bd-type quinol oxidase subunit 2